MSALSSRSSRGWASALKGLVCRRVIESTPSCHALAGLYLVLLYLVLESLSSDARAITHSCWNAKMKKIQCNPIFPISVHQSLVAYKEVINHVMPEVTYGTAVNACSVAALWVAGLRSCWVFLFCHDSRNLCRHVALCGEKGRMRPVRIDAMSKASFRWSFARKRILTETFSSISSWPMNGTLLVELISPLDMWNVESRGNCGTELGHSLGIRCNEVSGMDRLYVETFFDVKVDKHSSLSHIAQEHTTSKANVVSGTTEWIEDKGFVFCFCPQYFLSELRVSSSKMAFQAKSVA